MRSGVLYRIFLTPVVPYILLFQGYMYSSASRLVGVEISAEFVQLQSMAVEKYGFSDRIQVNGSF